VQSAQESDAFVDRIEQHFADHGWGYWAIEIPGVAPFIGFVGLSSTTLLDAPMVEIGWRLDKRHWNNGYATEAARAALDFGFGDLDLDEIVAYRPRQSAIPAGHADGMTYDAAEDFVHPNIPAADRLQPFVLYRIRRSRR